MTLDPDWGNQNRVGSHSRRACRDGDRGTQSAKPASDVRAPRSFSIPNRDRSTELSVSGVGGEVKHEAHLAETGSFRLDMSFSS